MKIGFLDSGKIKRAIHNHNEVCSALQVNSFLALNNMDVDWI